MYGCHLSPSIEIVAVEIPLNDSRVGMIVQNEAAVAHMLELEQQDVNERVAAGTARSIRAPRMRPE